MTEIERKALALVNEACKSDFKDLGSTYRNNLLDALLRAIEQHEAFRQEVSDAVEEWDHRWIGNGGPHSHFRVIFNRFIIAKPVDPFVALVGEAFWNDPNEPDAVHCAACILAGLKARGLEVRKIEEGKP